VPGGLFCTQRSGKIDVVALQVVTVGPRATERFAELEAAGEYTEGYFLHGLAVQMAEAAAITCITTSGESWALPQRGKRYSWGYPAIPSWKITARCLTLLPAESALGMVLTSAYQLVPEQSTAAIIVHHPDAKYFNVGTSRVEQLMNA
jgi:5-methyltetrahydrofolate--homocysteine methyltransferase